MRRTRPEAGYSGVLLRECFAIIEGFEAALNRKSVDRCYRRKIRGEEEAHLIATRCSDPPDGQARWTLRLLADKMVELQYVDSICPETVRQALKKRIKALAEKRVVHSTTSDLKQQRHY